MPNTSRVGIPYPSEYQDPFFTTFESGMNAIDDALYAAREDRNIVVMAGGTWVWNATSGVLSWSSAFELNASITGLLWTVAAGNVTLADGEMLYLNLVRSPTTNKTLTALTASSVPTSDEAIMIALRRGDSVYFRTGSILNDGDSSPLFESSTGAYDEVALCFDGKVDGVTSLAEFGGRLITPQLWSSAGGQTLKFQAVLWVSDVARTATATLYNVTDGEAVTGAVLTTSSTTPVALTSAALSVGVAPGDLQASAKVYEVWLANDGTVITEVVSMGSAVLLVV